MKRIRLLAGLVLGALLTGGCAGIAMAAFAVDAIVGGVGIYQRLEDRQAQNDQTAEIKALRDEIARHRLALPPPAAAPDSR